ncbi:MAG TPA: hypothetical protein VFA90_00165 [Terriglobales bacterium]|nr:hypothetical protein [Terriglobales bacterium]
MPPKSITTFTHHKQQGEWAELLFMARAAEQGFTIALAATNGQLELLLTPHRPTSKYGEYEEAWHLLHNEK